MSVNEIFASRLKEICEKQERTQISLSQKLNISQGQLSKLMNGHKTPTPDLLVSLSRELNTSLEYLLGVVSFDNPVCLIEPHNLRDLAQSPSAYFYMQISEEQRETIDTLLKTLVEQNCANSAQINQNEK